MNIKENDSCVVTCLCGCCEGLVASKLDGKIYLSFISSDFYTKQQQFDLIKTSIKLLRGKKVIKDILCEKEDLERLRDFLLTADYHEDEKSKNDSHLIVCYDKDFGYMLMLMSDLKKSDIIRLKAYRAYDIALSRKERDVLIQRIDHAIKKAEKITNGKKNYITLENINKEKKSSTSCE